MAKRAVLASLAGILAIAPACAQTSDAGAAAMAPAQPAPAHPSAARAAIEAAVAAPTRSAANRARDPYRNPVETLSFFQVEPSDTIVELIPGGGWYTEILAPLAMQGGGRYIAAGGMERGLNGVRALQAANPALYGGATLVSFPATETSSLPDGTADVVLTFRNVHNLRFAGLDQTAAAFRQMFAMLKPGGRLGIVEHRLPETMDSALEETSGYMKTSSVIAFAQAAGFQLVGQSEINANPRDTHDHPRGVWTLPPVLRGAADDAERARWRAIGESDRMTLLFVKPG